MKIKIIVHTLITNNGEVLLIQRSKNVTNLPEYWDIPGGSLKRGEDPTSGAVREALEETSLEIRKPKLYFSYSNSDKTKNMHFITLVYRAEVSDKSIMLNPEEHQDSIWVDMNTALDFVKNNDCPDYLEPAINAMR